MASGKQMWMKEHSSSSNEIHSYHEVIGTMVKNLDDASSLCLVGTITACHD
jgi:hypothetical protein